MLSNEGHSAYNSKVRGTLVIFLKNPVAGRVKTRIARQSGDFEALAIYRNLIERLLLNLQGCDQVELRHDGELLDESIKELSAPTWTTSNQGTGDLGCRLASAFQAHFNAGKQPVVIIGSDCPYVQTSDIEAAFTALSDNEIVLGPALDGGYWLIGLAQFHSELFEKINWSTETVLDETLERAKKLGLKISLLRKLRDIDTIEDWQEFQGTINENSHSKS